MAETLLESLVLFQKIQWIVMAADKTLLEVVHTSLARACVSLLASYYVFNLDYPQAYQPLLCFLQEHLLGEMDPEPKSHEYRRLMDKLRREQGGRC